MAPGVTLPRDVGRADLGGHVLAPGGVHTREDTVRYFKSCAGQVAWQRVIDPPGRRRGSPNWPRPRRRHGHVSAKNATERAFANDFRKIYTHDMISECVCVMLQTLMQHAHGFVHLQGLGGEMKHDETAERVHLCVAIQLAILSGAGSDPDTMDGG